MEHFVTIFDSLYMPQGLALLSSMQRHLKDFTLWVVCMDQKTFEILKNFDSPRLELLELGNLENHVLKNLKGGRTRAEYCWTLTPMVPKFVFDLNPSVKRVTYIDSDLWFLRNPLEIFQELQKSLKSVLITEHNYSSEYSYLNKFGRFCVQFMIFKREESERVRKWWEARCCEWCYNRLEDGKFGDQKYLDEWENIFPDDVHVLQNKNLALAPWNATIFHFHGVRLINSARIHLGRYEIPYKILTEVYRPYYRDLKDALRFMKEQGLVSFNQVSGGSIFISFLKRIKEAVLLNRNRVWMVDAI